MEGRVYKFDDEDKTRMVKLKEQGCTNAQIAARFNTSRQTIERILRTLRKSPPTTF